MDEDTPTDGAAGGSDPADPEAPEEPIEESPPTFEDIDDEPGDGDQNDDDRGRRVPVDPSSGDLRPEEFHRQDWLLIAEAITKVTRGYFSFSNFLEDRTEYARGLVPAIVAEAGVPNEDFRKYIDYWWDGSEPVDPQGPRPKREPEYIQSAFVVESDESDKTVEVFTPLDWLVVAEALNAWRADLHLGGPDDTPRASDRDVELKNAAVRAAGYDDVDDILPIARELYREHSSATRD